MLTKRHAQRDAEELAARLNASLGGGWEPYVWENLGWHFRAVKTNGRDREDPEARTIAVYPFTYPPDAEPKTTYSAMVSDDSGPGMPSYYMPLRGERHFDDPAEAVRAMLPYVEAHVEQVTKTLAHLRAALGQPC